MLAICDNDKPVAVAGVMGGANSEIMDDTKIRRFRVRKLPRRYRSYHRKGARYAYRASGRFEKGLDPPHDPRLQSTVRAN